MPILRFGQTGNAVPEPQLSGMPADAPTPKAIEITSHTCASGGGGSNSLSFRVSQDCLSTGGFESTVRLRLLILHPTQDLVLAFVDTTRFVVMTRELPSANRMFTYLQHWGLRIHAEDEETQAHWRELERRSNKKRKLVKPVEWACDDEQEDEPVAVSMPDGKLLFCFRGLQRLQSATAVSDSPSSSEVAAAAAEAAVAGVATGKGKGKVAPATAATFRAAHAQAHAGAGFDTLASDAASLPAPSLGKSSARPRRSKRHHDEVAVEESIAAPALRSSPLAVDAFANADACSEHEFAPASPSSNACLDLDAGVAWSCPQPPCHDSESDAVTRGILGLGAEDFGLVAAGFAKAFSLPMRAEDFTALAQQPFGATSPAFGCLGIMTPVAVSHDATAHSHSQPRSFLCTPVGGAAQSLYSWPTGTA